MAETCSRGHPRTPENTYLYEGRRHCRACKALRDLRYRAKRGLPAGQAGLLRRIELGVPTGGPAAPDVSSLQALLRRGLIYRTAGQYRLTEAGVQVLTAT